MPNNKQSVFSPRTLLQSLELSFDFLRQNRSIWFRCTLMLLVPCAVFVTLFFPREDRMYSFEDSLRIMESFVESHGFIILLGNYCGVLLSLSLVRMYTFDRIPDKVGWRNLFQMIRPCWRPTAVLMFIIYVLQVAVFQNDMPILLLILTIPLWLMIPTFSFLGVSVAKSIKLVFVKWLRHWLMSAFVFITLSLLGFLFLFSVQILFSLFQLMLNEVGLLDGQVGRVVLNVCQTLNMSVLAYVMFAASSVFGNALPFLVCGLANDEVSADIESEIEQFENL